MVETEVEVEDRVDTVLVDGVEDCPELTMNVEAAAFTESEEVL